MSDWTIYTGTKRPHAAKLPAAPPWRRFDSTPTPAGLTFRATPQMVEAVNAALVLRRPLLLTGRPGSGKSSLIDSVARELKLGPVLRWHVTSASTLDDALYRYDAIGRLQARSLDEQTSDIEGYLRLGPLGTALQPVKRPRALLIDEIDKSDIDLPNDLLNVFERGEFDIPELARLDRATVQVRGDNEDHTYPITRGRVQCREFPFVVMTNNGERDFPPAFLRRCIRLRMPDPTPELLADIVAAHLGPEIAAASNQLITDFAERAKQSKGYATDQLMNAIYLVTRDAAPAGDDRARIIELLTKQLTADQA
jgi:MoxR-like ATPase